MKKTFTLEPVYQTTTWHNEPVSQKYTPIAFRYFSDLDYGINPADLGINIIELNSSFDYDDQSKKYR